MQASMNKLYLVRIASGLTQSDVARLAHTHQESISCLERGFSEGISQRVKRDICRVLGFAIEDIFPEEKEKTRPCESKGKL
jgi:DNA-binding XRE family transcriptional regulator